MRNRRYVATAAIPLLLVAVGCSKDKDKEANKGAATQACGELLKPADASAALPADVPAGVSGATFYEVQSQGQTKTYFAYLKATDLVAVRDGIKDAYTQASVEVKGTDQEPGAEAELEFKKGSTEGTVQVIPYCDGYVRLRYRTG